MTQRRPTAQEIAAGHYIVQDGVPESQITQADADDLALCACLDCLWLGIAAELSAQACPRCDGRVAEQGSAEFTERLHMRIKNAAACPTCGNLCHTR